MSRGVGDRADRLQGKATIVSGFRLGRSEVLRSLRQSQYLRAHSQRHCPIDRLGWWCGIGGGGGGSGWGGGPGGESGGMKS